MLPTFPTRLATLAAGPGERGGDLVERQPGFSWNADAVSITRSADGGRVAPACLDCHELRPYNFRNWPHADLAAAWHGILACLKHEGFRMATKSPIYG